MTGRQRRLPPIVRAGLALLTVLVIVAGAGLAALSAVYSPTYVYRWAAWQDSDVGDHARFPARAVPAAPRAFQFSTPTDPDATADGVRAALEASELVTGDADAFLRETGTQAFIVVKDDEVLYERYFGSFERDSIATSFSVAKSFLSALVGIAIENGDIGGVDDPVTEYVPELLERDDRFADITIGHLLDMTSGIRFEETGLPNGDDALTYYFDDLRSLATDRTEIVEGPGRRWQYVDYNPLLLGLVLERATHRRVSDLLADWLWTPLGAEFDASWSLDRPDGFEKMESGINARPIDCAKLGRLYLETGAWDGEQLVPREWVETSTDPGIRADAVEYPAGFEQEYGEISHARYWWRIARPDGSHAYTALGKHGQFVFVVPDERLIVVRNGERYGIRSFDWFGVLLTAADALGDG